VSDVDQLQRRRIRASGEGSLYRRTRRARDGRPYTRWVAQISLGGREGRRIVRRVCETKTEAKAALVEMLTPARPTPPQQLQPLGAYLRRWLAETAAPSVSANTLRGYEDALAHLEPIADVPLAELTPEDIERALAGMTTRRLHARKQEPASPKTVRNVQIFLRRALGHAEQRGHIERNVARLVPLRRVPRHHVEALTPERARAILEAVAGDRYAAAYALALCGLRASEILGLAWSDLDKGRTVATVRYQLSGSGLKAKRVQLKTAASEKPVPLPSFVTERLVTHHSAQMRERAAAGVPTEEGLVFVTLRGLPVAQSWLTKHFQALLSAAGLPTMRLHDLRHGAASLLVGAGVHPRVAQQLLRHASSKTTTEIYSHVTAAQERQAAEVLERAVAG
jgi:integrase